MQHPQGLYENQARAARKFLISQQHDLGEKGQMDDPRDGGIGYGGSSTTSDMSNTHFALEALYYAKALDAEKPDDNEPKLNYAAAIQFISNCQNLKKHNAAAWVSEDEANKGGFIYEPGVSKAPEMKLPDGKVALRSYGSISYAGLLSLIYAELKPDDERIKAVLTWLQSNYTVEENPGMEQQGLYYYYHSMAKALNVVGLKELKLKDGRKVDWRQELAMKLLNTQQPAGTWTNATARWRESDTIYATSLATLALIHIHNAL
jgi:squalene-hopene/tetraprenyl-beta-curcumene cyclase